MNFDERKSFVVEYLPNNWIFMSGPNHHQTQLEYILLERHQVAFINKYESLHNEWHLIHRVANHFEVLLGFILLSFFQNHIELIDILFDEWKKESFLFFDADKEALDFVRCLPLT